MYKRIQYLIGICCALGLIFAFMAKKTNNDIDLIDVQHAQKLSGVNFTESEINLALKGINKLKEDYESLRKHQPANEIPPAFWFDPRPAGFENPVQVKRARYSKLRNVKRPENLEELAFAPIPELAYLLMYKKVTSVELTEMFINRLKKYNPKLHCVISLTEDLAMDQAKKADEEIAAGKYKGLLHGIPYGAKDLLSTRNYKTTWGATPYKDQVIDEDAEVIKRLEDAGAVLVAKLTLGALAMNDVWFGEKTRNPWKPDEGSSGSSAGSASAVSAGLVPFAIGTETYGSIVSPSTVCGTTGLRPTFGMVSRTGAMALSWTMDKIGPITRYVEDAAIVFEAIYGKDQNDPSTVDYPFHYDAYADAKKVKVGYIKSDFEGDYSFKENDQETLDKMKELGFELVPIELPDYPVREMTLIIDVESAAAFEELTLSNKDDMLVNQTENSWPNYFRTARFIPAIDYVQANRVRTKLINDMENVFSKVDVYLAPSWHGTNLPLTNLTGHPSVVLPNGFKDGKPTSITFNGKLYDEGTLLSVAKAYQDATDHNRQHPDVDNN